MNNLVLLFTNPKQLFTKLKEDKPKILIPFIIVSLLMIFSLILSQSEAINIGFEQMKAQGLNGLTEQDAKAQIEFYYNITYLFAPIGFLLGSMILSLIVYFLQGMDSDESADYKEVLMIVLYAGIIGNIGAAIGTLIGHFIQDFSFSFSLVYFLKIPPSEDLLYQVLSYINPFVFWQFFIMATGIAVYNKFSLKKALLIVVLANVIIVVVFNLFFMALQKAFPQAGA